MSVLDQMKRKEAKRHLDIDQPLKTQDIPESLGRALLAVGCLTVRDAVDLGGTELARRRVSRDLIRQLAEVTELRMTINDDELDRLPPWVPELELPKALQEAQLRLRTSMAPRAIADLKDEALRAAVELDEPEPEAEPEEAVPPPAAAPRRRRGSRATAEA